VDGQGARRSTSFWALSVQHKKCSDSLAASGEEQVYSSAFGRALAGAGAAREALPNSPLIANA